MGGWQLFETLFWGSRPPALVLVDDRHRSDDALGRVATLEEAKAQFRKSWDAWLAWAELQEVP